MQATAVSRHPPKEETLRDIVVARPLLLTVVMLSWLITWGLSHPYTGIKHDARLYTLQALAHLHPESLSHDVFLAYGSQDQYTLFSPIYATLMSWLGIEPAAALLTFVMQLALLGGALLLTRKLTSPLLTLIGVTVLIALPGIYGADRVFTYFEDFVTPRMGAEACVLFGLVAALRARVGVALGLMALGMLLHPIMAAPGFVALGLMYIAIPRPRLGMALGGAALLLLVVPPLVMPWGPFARFDAEWLQLVRMRNANLYLANWTPDDWQRTVTPLATLVLGVVTLPAGRARLLCLAVLLTAVTGLVVSAIGADGLDVIRITQLQPWRWMWLANALAALLLPTMVVTQWRSGTAGKAIALLWVAVWVLGNEPVALYALGAALIGLVCLKRLPQNVARLLYYGAIGLVVIAGLARLAWNSLFLDAYYIDPAFPLWLRQTISFIGDGVVPVALVVLAVGLSLQRWGTYALAVLGVGAMATTLAVCPSVYAGWTHEQFPPALVAQFASLRAIIPHGTQVLWPESPVESWVLLDRPLYFSAAQTTGLLFSRATAMEMRRRADVLSAGLPYETFFAFGGDGLTLGPKTEILTRICRTGDVAYLVTGAHLNWAPVAEAPASVWHNSKGLRLYRCADQPG